MTLSISKRKQNSWFVVSKYLPFTGKNRFFTVATNFTACQLPHLPRHCQLTQSVLGYHSSERNYVAPLEFGGLNSSFFGIWGLSPPSPYVESPLVFTPKILMSFFLVIDQVFQIFPFFFQILHIFTLLKGRIWPFLHKKKRYFRKEFLDDTFFTLFVLSRASDNTTSQNIVGGERMLGPPPVQILGGPSPSPPQGLRPWTQH